MSIPKAPLFVGLVAGVQGGLIIGLYRYGVASLVPLILLYVASLAACYVLLNRSARRAGGGPGRHSLRFVVALAIAGAVQLVAVVAALAIAFNVWGT